MPRVLASGGEITYGWLLMPMTAGAGGRNPERGMGGTADATDSGAGVGATTTEGTLLVGTVGAVAATCVRVEADAIVVTDFGGRVRATGAEGTSLVRKFGAAAVGVAETRATSALRGLALPDTATITGVSLAAFILSNACSAAR